MCGFKEACATRNTAEPGHENCGISNSVSESKLPKLPPELEEQRIVIGDDAMETVHALYVANLLFKIGSYSVAGDRCCSGAERRKMEWRVRKAEKSYVRARCRLQEFWIPPSVQEVIDEHCAVQLMEDL